MSAGQPLSTAVLKVVSTASTVVALPCREKQQHFVELSYGTPNAVSQDRLGNIAETDAETNELPFSRAPTAPPARIASSKDCLRENGTFFEFSLCSSRACLGKMLIFIYKWLKKCRFLT
jgi:hypothetical protein